MTPLPTNLTPRTLEGALGVIAQLVQIIAEQQAQIVALQARVAELEARLGQNSQNSSRSPSSDSPTVIRPAKRARSGRKPGGQLCSSKKVRASPLPCVALQPETTPKIRPMAAVTAIARAPPMVTRNAARPSGAPPR